MAKNTWTNEDIEKLREKYATSTNDQLIEIFPNRTLIGIYKKAYKLHLHKTEETIFKNRSLCRQGEKNSNWKGGKMTSKKGYILLKCPNHPRADKKGYVMEHILVFERESGISVPLNCDIHHLDGNKKNNDISNLCLMSHGGHTKYHKERKDKK